MKTKLSTIFAVAALMLATSTSYAQVKEDLKTAGEKTKDAAVVGAKKTGKGTKKVYKASTHAVKKATHKSADATAKAADKVADKTAPK